MTTSPKDTDREPARAGEEFRQVAEGVAAEPRWTAIARRWSHRSLREEAPEISS